VNTAGSYSGFIIVLVLPWALKPRASKNTDLSMHAEVGVNGEAQGNCRNA
jgi:hypothetical protein